MGEVPEVWKMSDDTDDKCDPSDICAGCRCEYSLSARTMSFTKIPTAELEALRARVTELERDAAQLRQFKGAAIPCCTSIDPRGYQWCEAYLDTAIDQERGK